jgi:IS30 family transposase
MSISHEAIYRHIYTRPQASLNKKLIKLLVRKIQGVGLRKKDVVQVAK